MPRESYRTVEVTCDFCGKMEIHASKRGAPKPKQYYEVSPINRWGELLDEGMIFCSWDCMEQFIVRAAKRERGEE